MKQGEPFNVLRDRNSWSNAPRAEAVAFQILAATGITATQTAIAVATTVASLAISVATSAIISALTPAPPSPKQSLLVNARDAAAPQEIVYGETRKGGTITYLETTRGGSVLYQIIALAAHEIESVEEIYINDEVATLSNDAYSNSRRSGAGWVTNRNWSDDPDEHEIRIFYHLGDQTAITDKFANSSVETLDSVFFDTGSSDEDSQNFGGVGQPTKASFVGNGIAYLFVRFSYAADVFKNGIPVITAKIRGKKVFDPRTSTTAYSNNAALCIRDFLTSAYGLSDPEVDDTVFQAAANTCDEAVTLDAGGTEAHYTMNGVVRADQPYGDVLQEMVKSCAGTLFWGAGKWKLQPGEYNAPTKTFTLDDLRSEISLQTRVNLRDQFNRVQGVFSDANQRYIAADYPPIESPTFLAEDGDVEQTLDLDLPFTTSAATAQRLAKMTLFRGREQMTFSAEFGLNAFDVEVGEIVALTIDRYGWTGKEFEVIGWRFGANEEAGDLRVSLTLRETSSAAFDWNAEESDIIGNDSDLDNYNNDLTLSNLVASGGGKTQGDGTFINSCILSWDAPDNAYIARYDIQWKPTADSEYASTTTTETTAEISPLVDGVEYTFRVRAVSSRGNLGPFTTVLFTGGGDTTAPALPTATTADGGFGYISVRWTNPADADLNFVEVWENTSNTISGATQVGVSGGDEFVRTNLGISETRWYFLKAVDYSGNKSAFTSGVSGTTTFIDDDDFADGVYSLFTEQGLYAIEDVTSLPASGDFTGQKVFNRTDGKLYEWNGSAWTLVVAAVEAPDISGQLQTAQIANDAVTNALIANDAVQAENIANLAINADKIASNAVTVTKIADAAVEVGKIASNAVTESKIADLAISADKIASNAVTSVKIAASAVEAGKIATGAVTEVKIATSAITETKIASNAITTPKIAAGAVTADEISAGSITTGKIAAGAVTASEIAAGTITANEIATNTITSTNIAAGAVTASEILAGAVTADKIASNSITSAKIAAGTIQASDIAAGTITGDKISTNTLTATNIAAGAITASELSTGAVTATKIAADAITTSKIAAGAVTATEIASNSITSAKIVAGAIQASDIAAGAITATQIAAGTITGNKIVANTITGGLLATSGIITNSAQINNGLITSAKIQNAAITNAKIGNLEVDSAKIANLTVGTGKITDNATSNLTYEQITSSVDNVGQNNNWQEFLVPSPWIDSDNKPVTVTWMVEGNFSSTVGATAEIRIRRAGVVIFEGPIPGAGAAGAQFFASGALTWPNPYSSGVKWSLDLRTSSSFGLQNVNGSMSVQVLKK